MICQKYLEVCLSFLTCLVDDGQMMEMMRLPPDGGNDGKKKKIIKICLCKVRGNQPTLCLPSEIHVMHTTFYAEVLLEKGSSSKQKDSDLDTSVLSHSPRLTPLNP